MDAVFNYDVPDEQEIMSTASAHRPRQEAWRRLHFVASVTDQIKMDEIAQAQKMEMQLLKYDKDGCLMIQ